MCNASGDVIYTNDDIQPPNSVLPDLQCFWEAFPSGSGATDRTTYMFTYIDAQPHRPSLVTMMEEYWQRMPKYQVQFAAHLMNDSYSLLSRVVTASPT